MGDTPIMNHHSDGDNEELVTELVPKISGAKVSEVTRERNVKDQPIRITKIRQSGSSSSSGSNSSSESSSRSGTGSDNSSSENKDDRETKGAQNAEHQVKGAYLPETEVADKEGDGILLEPVAIDNQPAVREKNLEKSATASIKQLFSKIRKDAHLIKPYQGELTPKNLLHSSMGFASVHSKNHDERSVSNFTNTHDPVVQIFNILAPKLEELSKLRRFQLKNFDFARVSLIAKGSFGQVHRRKFMGDQDVAVKQFMDCRRPIDIFKEVHMLIYLQHSRILKIYGAFFENMITNVVTELHKGSIHQHAKILLRRQVIRFTVQLLEGLEFMHSKNIVHCNLNPENCFITSYNNVVIGEFGKAQLLPQGTEFIRVCIGEPLLGSKMYSDALSNTGIYSKATDIFAIGCTIFEMDVGEPLMEYQTWETAPVEEYINVARTGRLLDFPPAQLPDRSGVCHGWQLNGPRESLKTRVNRCTLFKRLVWDMVKFKESGRRLGAEELLNKYRSFFEESLNDVGLRVDELDQDPNLATVKLRPVLATFKKPYHVSNRLATAMDHIYYDANLNLRGMESGNVTESQQNPLNIGLDQLKEVMDKVYTNHAIQVVRATDGFSLGADTSIFPVSSRHVLSNDPEEAVTEDTELQSLKLDVNRERALIKVDNVKIIQHSKSLSKFVTELPKSGFKKALFVKKKFGDDQHSKPASEDVTRMRRKPKTEQIKPIETVSTEAPFKPEQNTSSTTQRLERSPTPTSDWSINQPCSSSKKKYRRVIGFGSDSDDDPVSPTTHDQFRAEPAPCISAKPDVKEPKGPSDGKKMRGPKTKKGSRVADTLMTSNDNDADFSRQPSTSTTPQKNKRTVPTRDAESTSEPKKARDIDNEQKKSQGGTRHVPMKDRGIPARPKNVPAHVKAAQTPGWRGWFECECSEFYNVDYEIVEEHRRTCPFAVEEKKRRECNR